MRKWIQDLWKGIQPYAQKALAFGKQSVGVGALLWILDFTVVRQATQIGKAYVERGLTAAWEEAENILTRIAILLGVTILLGFLTYASGEAWALFLLPLFAVMLVVTTMYIQSIALAVVGVVQLLRGTPAGQSGDTILKKVGKITNHILYWICIFLLLNLMFKPWLPGQFEKFATLVLAEAAWFFLNTNTRRWVRFASVTVSGAAAIIVFVILLGWLAHLHPTTGALWDRGMANLTQNVDTGLNWWGQVSLSTEKEIVDANQNGTIDVEADAIAIETLADAYRFDTARVYWVVKGGLKYPLGDFDGDGVPEKDDALAFRMWRQGKGPGPASLSTRVGIPVQRSAEPVLGSVESQEPADVPIVPQQQRTKPFIPVPEPQESVEESRMAAQYASVIVKAEKPTQPVDDAVQPNVRAGVDSAHDTHAPSSDYCTVFDTVFADILWLDSTEGFRVGVSEIHAGEAGTDVKFVWVAPPGTKNARQRAIACVHKFTYLRSTDPDTCYAVRQYLTGLKPTQSVLLEPGKPYEAVIRFDPLQPGIQWLMVCLKDFKQKFYPSPYFAVS